MPPTLDSTLAAAPPAAPAAGRLDVLLRILHAVRHPRPGSGRVGPARTAMHFLRCAAHLDTFRGWLGNPANPALRAELAARPGLLTCVVHPYLNSDWTASRRLEVIGAHYALLAGRLAWLGAPLRLAEAHEGLLLELERPGRFEHEGEATLHLRCGATDLYAIAFTLGRLDGERVTYVGALQGLHSPDALDIYRTLTHRLHGLRPRDLLVTAFRRFVRGLGVTRILAVDDRRRVGSNAYYVSHAQVRTSYDAVWLECGGVAAADGFYAIGTEPVRRAADAVPARKRALYRRRYAMLDVLDERIDAAVAAASDT